ncbi:hypothetical protein BS78_09G055200 [Paspalum vaginatum]|nr:hypothetical protein BS78_09G055200 [Paspalum vaginatum]
MAHCHDLLVAVAVVAAFLAVAEASTSVGFDLHHRFSPVIRRWAEARGHTVPQWPAEGSPEYYSELSRHDRAHHARRGLAGAAADRLLAFAAGGNLTYQYLGALYYAYVSVGTPNLTFLVALDTGSDLFWLPCDCKQCANVSKITGEQMPWLRPYSYSPSLSSTSSPVRCDDALCGRPNACGAAGSCPYTVRYMSPNTSSSGVLVEDVLHLTYEAPTEALRASVVFGCGQVQTGMLLDGPMFDGVLGLGMDQVSVPSMLATKGLVASDSFSMCFGVGEDFTGRLNFGDTGSADQDETPFTVSSTFPTYNVSFTTINVGNKSAPVEFAAVMDSGTSYTLLNDPEYTDLATNFNAQVHEKRANFSNSPFEYCYSMSPNQTEVFVPYMSLTTKGGALFPVTQPIVGIFDIDRTSGRRHAIGYCLAIQKGDININIIGQNFMAGLKVVFNRERSVLGWQKFDCYKNARVADAPGVSPIPSPSPSPSPSVGVAPAGGPTTKLTPRQNDANNRNPSAAPRPASASARNFECALGGLWLLLPLLLGTSLV